MIKKFSELVYVLKKRKIDLEDSILVLRYSDLEDSIPVLPICFYSMYILIFPWNK